MDRALFNHTTFEFILFGSSGAITLLTIVLTLFSIYLHLTYFTDVEAQTSIIRIILMAIIYSVTSTISILFVEYAVYFELVRDCYESFVLYQFFSLLLYYYNTEASTHYNIEDNRLTELISISDNEPYNNDGSSSIEDEVKLDPLTASTTINNNDVNVVEPTTGYYMAKTGFVKYPFPLCWLSPVIPSDLLLIRIRRCIFQYVLLKPILSMLAIILHTMDLYHPGSYNPSYGYVWIALALNISIGIALYYLIFFYHIIHHVVKRYRPLSKLMAVKAVLFFTFWQSVLIASLYHFHLIPSLQESWGVEQSASVLNNVIICIEMFILSVSHIFIFSHRDYSHYNAIVLEDVTSDTTINNIESKNKLNDLVKHVLNPIDMIKDGKNIIIGKETIVF